MSGFGTSRWRTSREPSEIDQRISMSLRFGGYAERAGQDDRRVDRREAKHWGSLKPVSLAPVRGQPTVWNEQVPVKKGGKQKPSHDVPVKTLPKVFKKDELRLKEYLLRYAEATKPEFHGTHHVSRVLMDAGFITKACSPEEFMHHGSDDHVNVYIITPKGREYVAALQHR